MTDRFVFKDPLLYLSSVFLLEGGSLPAKKIAQIFTNQFLPLIQSQSGLTGSGEQPTEFTPAADLSIEFWNVQKNLNEKEQIKAFAKSHSDSVILLLGADEEGEFEINSIDDWTENEIKKINSTYWDDSKLAELIRYPQEDSLDERRLRLIGQAWVLVAEMTDWTIRDWRNFAVQRYAQGGWVRFGWGTMGYIPAQGDELPRLELLFETKHKKTILEFLYKRDLSAFLVAFLKISQFIRYRFQKTQATLRQHSARIEEWRKRTIFDQPNISEDISIVKYLNSTNSKPVRLGSLEKTVRFGNKILLSYSTSISDLAEYIHTVEVNQTIIEQLFSKHQGKVSPFSAAHFWHREISLLGEQMNVEQKYHDIIYNHLRAHFESLKVIAEVKKSHFEYLLALVAIVFGAIVGFAQVLTSVEEAFWKNVIIVIIIVFIVVSLILACVLSIERFKAGDGSE